MFRIAREFVRPDTQKPTSVALGLFDGIHLGHYEVLSKALENKECSPCVFTYTISGELPANKQNYRRLMADDYKCELLKRMGFELVVMPDFDAFKDLAPEEFVEEMLINRMGAKELTCGYDFTFGKMGKGNTDLLCKIAEKHGVKVNIISPISQEGIPISSTRIRRAVMDGNMELAAELLGRRFSICLPVEHGNQLGRLLEFPTINQIFPDRHIIPCHGVYSTIVKVDDNLYGGVTNVGLKPTIGTDRPLAETYILNYSGDLYGKQVEVYFFRFLRPEVRFVTINLLKEQIARDKESVEKEYEANIFAVMKQKQNGEELITEL